MAYNEILAGRVAMASDYALLILGILCAAAGGELFVRGAVGIAQWMRVTPGLIGVTVAAFATSSPELSVSIQASMAGKPQISLGDALGSNVVNVSLILGMALCISGIKVPRGIFKRDYAYALLVAVAPLLLLLDGMLSRLDGGLLMCAFLTWATMVVREARRQREAAGEVLGAGRIGLALLAGAAGLACLVAAGGLVVSGARGIALRHGVGEFVIGATIVAVGTSMPELATTLVSRLRGHYDVGLGTVLGSNVFNGLFIVGLASLICPIKVGWSEAAVACGFGLAAILAIWPGSGYLGRGRGVLLVLLYGVYLAMVLARLAG